jgi:hypothetical protein
MGETGSSGVLAKMLICGGGVDKINARLVFRRRIEGISQRSKVMKKMRICLQPAKRKIMAKKTAYV